MEWVGRIEATAIIHTKKGETKARSRSRKGCSQEELSKDRHKLARKVGESEE